MENKPTVWLNNEIIPWEQAQFPILSHGLSRGSAIFEVFGTYENEDATFAFRMDKHLARLERTAALLDMELRYDIDEIAAATAKLARENNMGRGIVKIVACWGQEAIINLVLEDKLDVAIFCIPAFDDLSLDEAKPFTACFSKWRKLHPETVPVEAKACANYLNGYLIRKDANKRGYDLGINVGTDGFLAEGSIESVFIVKDGVLKTPPLGRILASVTRDSIIQVAKDNDIPLQETILAKEDVIEADEMFTCHTGIRVLPIRQVEDHDMPAPGPVTEKISQSMDAVFSLDQEKYMPWFQKLFDK